MVIRIPGAELRARHRVPVDAAADGRPVAVRGQPQLGVVRGGAEDGVDAERGGAGRSFGEDDGGAAGGGDHILILQWPCLETVLRSHKPKKLQPHSEDQPVPWSRRIPMPIRSFETSRPSTRTVGRGAQLHRRTPDPQEAQPGPAYHPLTPSMAYT